MRDEGIRPRRPLRPPGRRCRPRCPLLAGPARGAGSDCATRAGIVLGSFTYEDRVRELAATIVETLECHRKRSEPSHDRHVDRLLPAVPGKNLGFAYNELMARLHDEDWACFLDHDACFTTYGWYPQLEDITARLTEPCILTAMTNRVGSRWQLRRASIATTTRWSIIGRWGRRAVRSDGARSAM